MDKGATPSWEQIHRTLFPGGPVPPSLLDTKGSGGLGILGPAPSPVSRDGIVNQAMSSMGSKGTGIQQSSSVQTQSSFTPQMNHGQGGGLVMPPAPPAGTAFQMGNHIPRPPLPPPSTNEGKFHFPAPPPAPRDRKMVHDIEIFAAFVAKYGSEHETKARAEQQGNPKCSFLFGGEHPGSELSVGLKYYEWKKGVLMNVLEARKAVVEGKLPPDQLKSMERELEHYSHGNLNMKDFRPESAVGAPEPVWNRNAGESGIMHAVGDRQQLSGRSQSASNVVDSAEKDKRMPRSEGDACSDTNNSLKDWRKGTKHDRSRRDSRDRESNDDPRRRDSRDREANDDPRRRDSRDRESNEDPRRRKRSRSRSQDRGRHRHRSRSPPRRSRSPRRRQTRGRTHSRSPRHRGHSSRTSPRRDTDRKREADERRDDHHSNNMRPNIKDSLPLQASPFANQHVRDDHHLSNARLTVKESLPLEALAFPNQHVLVHQQVIPQTMVEHPPGFVADNAYGRYISVVDSSVGQNCPQGSAQHHSFTSNPSLSQDSGLLRVPASFSQVGAPFVPTLSEIPASQQQFLLQQLQLSQIPQNTSVLPGPPKLAPLPVHKSLREVQHFPETQQFAAIVGLGQASSQVASTFGLQQQQQQQPMANQQQLLQPISPVPNQQQLLQPISPVPNQQQLLQPISPVPNQQQLLQPIASISISNLQQQQLQHLPNANTEKYDPLRPASPSGDVEMEVVDPSSAEIEIDNSEVVSSRSEANVGGKVDSENVGKVDTENVETDKRQSLSPRKGKDKQDGGDEDCSDDNGERVQKSKNEKDGRALKVVRNAVAEFVKELLTPNFREGILSKEVFKVIAKKAVNKVVGNLQGSQIPKGQERVDRFLSSSKEKITKLVQEYVEKHTKHANAHANADADADADTDAAAAAAAAST